MSCRDTDGAVREALELCWLGQSGFEISDGMQTVLIDPWISDSDHRLAPAPSQELLSPRIDYVLVTHEHGDHLDLPGLASLASLRPGFVLIVPTPLVGRASSELPTIRVLGIQPGHAQMIGRATVTAVPALHGVTVEDGYSYGLDPHTGQTPFVGYVLRWNKIVVYHAGDTIYGAELVERVAGERPDLALLPINGRDEVRERRGVVGNLRIGEAADLAVEVGCRIVIPMHHDMVAGNTSNPAALIAELKDRESPVRVVTPARNVRFRVYSQGGAQGSGLSVK